jgi:hypothetical protein
MLSFKITQRPAVTIVETSKLRPLVTQYGVDHVEAFRRFHRGEWFRMTTAESADELAERLTAYGYQFTRER